jgi:hypothetical protein
MTVASHRLAVGGQTFPVTDPDAAARFASAYAAATGIKDEPHLVETPDTCAYCRQPIVKYPCRSWLCEDARSAYDKRVERMCDDQ